MARGDGIYLRGRSWYLDAYINGTRHAVCLGKGITRSVAKELAQVERAKILKGEAGIGRKKAKDITFEKAREKLKMWAKVEKKPNTQRSYALCLDWLAKEFGGTRLSEITSWRLEIYRKRRGEGHTLAERPDGVSDPEWARRCRVIAKGAPVRANRELAVLKTLFNKCLEWKDYEGENPVRPVRLRKEPQTRLRFLEPSEEARLLAAATEPIRTLIAVGIHTGLRVKAEGLQLRWDDVDLRRALLTVQAAYAKNHRTRTVPLNSAARAALERLQHTATTAFVFVDAAGDPLKSIDSRFRRVCRKAGLRGVTPHTLRHTFASRLVMSGADLRTVMDLGGWQRIEMVQRYAHLSPEHKARAVERLVQFPISFPNSELEGAETAAVSA